MLLHDPETIEILNAESHELEGVIGQQVLKQMKRGIQWPVWAGLLCRMGYLQRHTANYGDRCTSGM